MMGLVMGREISKGCVCILSHIALSVYYYKVQQLVCSFNANSDRLRIKYLAD